MPWAPQNEFEEEILKLQPDHDFIFGYLSEPQHPRPATHTDYATSRRLQEEEAHKISGASSAISSKLRMMQQVQSISNSKPVGEQPSLDDWDTNENLERETIGLMRHFGMGANVEQPLNENVTIASQPIINTNKVLKNGRRTLPLLLDDDMFKLREKVSPTSGLESCSKKSDKDDSVASEMGGATSFSTSSSLSFNTAVEDCDDSFSSAASYLKTPSKIANREELYQYEKLLEDTSSLSLDCSKISSSNHSSCESFKAFNRLSCSPVLVDHDHEFILNNKADWPSLSKTGNSCDIDSAEKIDSSNDIYNEASGAKPKKKEDYLDRLLKSIKSDFDTTEESISDLVSTTSSTQIPQPSKTPKTPKPPTTPHTFASVTKAPKPSEKKKEIFKPDYDTTFMPFYTTRKMYALKRHPK